MTTEEKMKLLQAAGIVVNGDLVLEKHVENEIGNVESGGIGIQVIQTNSENPQAVKGGEAVGVENGTTTERKGAGRPAEVLFADERLSAQEASRVKKFVEDNMLLGVKWNTSKGNTVRKMVVCFYKKWEELGFVEATQYPSSAAVVNFFVNECGISPNVSVDTLKNNTKPWQEEIDEDMMEIVCAIFPH